MTVLNIDAQATRAVQQRRETGLVLRPIRGNADAPMIPLGIGRFVIGSGPDADVRLEVAGVDAQHAVLMVGPQRSVLKAFSRFTWVNDGVIRECAVKPGDRLCIGPVEFEVLKGKSRRRPESTRAHKQSPASEPHAPARNSAWTATGSLGFLTELLPAPAVASGSSARREKVIGELNSELLQQLSQLVERETVAADRERRLIEHTAQLEGRRKIAEGRQAEIEQLQSELARSEAEWRRKSAELTEQCIHNRLERESLERDRARLTEETARLGSQLQEIEGRRAALDVRQARLEEQYAALDIRSAQLASHEQNHAAVVAQALASTQAHAEDVQHLAQQKALLQRLEEQLRQQQEQFERERTQYESDRDKLFAERAHLATREVEFTELRRRVHEQQAELEVRERQRQELVDQAGTQLSIDHEAASALATREECLAEEEAALAIQRNELDERKRDIDEQHAAWMLERHTMAARTSNSDDREAEQAAAIEVEMLRNQISELQTRLRDERGLWAQERAELAARADEALSAPAFVAEPGDPESLASEVAHLQALLEAERTRSQQERDAWEAEQDLILRDRQALEMEWRRLEARTDQPTSAPQPAAAVDETSEVVPPPIPAQFLPVHDEQQAMNAVSADGAWRDEQIFGTRQPASFADESAYGVDADPASAWTEGAGNPEAFDHSQQFAGSDSFDEAPLVSEMDQEQDVSDQMAHQPAGGGDVLSLRAQLAELFGIQSTDPPEQPAPNSFEAGAEDSFATDESMQHDPAASFESNDQISDDQFTDGGTEEPSEVESAVGERSDEDVMSAYLARILKKSPDDSFTQSVPSQPEPVSDEPEPADEGIEAQEPEQQKPTRRLNAEEKVTLRANLDSFRELANQQARAAVANHKSNELKSGMQLTSVITVLVMVVGLILITAEFWSSQSYRVYGLLCLAVAAAVGVYTLINGIRIRRLKSIARATAELTEALGDDETESAAIAE